MDNHVHTDPFPLPEERSTVAVTADPLRINGSFNIEHESRHTTEEHICEGNYRRSRTGRKGR